MGGQGVFGAVYKVRDPQLQQTVAIKVPRAGNLVRPPDVDCFLRATRLMAQLRQLLRFGAVGTPSRTWPGRGLLLAPPSEPGRPEKRP